MRVVWGYAGAGTLPVPIWSTGWSGDPEQQSRSWLRSSACHREPMPVPSNLLPRFACCRLGGAANAICEVGHKATGNFADSRRGSGIVMRNRDVRFNPRSGDQSAVDKTTLAIAARPDPALLCAYIESVR